MTTSHFILVHDDLTATEVSDLCDELKDVDGITPVSYTHLDVYKRQVEGSRQFPFGVFFLSYRRAAKNATYFLL